MKEIKYLAKFVSEESFANDLICGNLFMRPVWYFRELEKKNRIAYGTLCDSLCLCPRP